MQASNEMIEKYKREMQQMFAKSNQNVPAINSNTQVNPPLQEPPKPRLEDFPQFQNSGDELTRRIEEILRQNSDVARETDNPSNFSPPLINQTPQVDESTETRQQIASRTCIRGGQMAKYSPPANTGSSVGGEMGATPPLTDTADLIVEVFAANRAIPIQNAQIRIKNPDDNSVLAVLETDEDGRTASISLSAPDRNLSLQPQFPNPFVNYFADIRADGYLPQSDIKIQLFGGQKSLLPANMIPREEI